MVVLRDAEASCSGAIFLRLPHLYFVTKTVKFCSEFLCDFNSLRRHDEF